MRRGGAGKRPCILMLHRLVQYRLVLIADHETASRGRAAAAAAVIRIQSFTPPPLAPGQVLCPCVPPVRACSCRSTPARVAQLRAAPTAAPSGESRGPRNAAVGPSKLVVLARLGARGLAPVRRRAGRPAAAAAAERDAAARRAAALLLRRALRRGRAPRGRLQALVHGAAGAGAPARRRHGLDQYRAQRHHDPRLLRLLAAAAAVVGHAAEQPGRRPHHGARLRLQLRPARRVAPLRVRRRPAGAGNLHLAGRARLRVARDVVADPLRRAGRVHRRRGLLAAAHRPVHNLRWRHRTRTEPARSAARPPRGRQPRRRAWVRHRTCRQRRRQRPALLLRRPPGRARLVRLRVARSVLRTARHGCRDCARLRRRGRRLAQSRCTALDTRFLHLLRGRRAACLERRAQLWRSVEAAVSSRVGSRLCASRRSAQVRLCSALRIGRRAVCVFHDRGLLRLGHGAAMRRAGRPSPRRYHCACLH